MKEFWDMTIKFANQCWDKTLEFFAQLNAWIPLSTILIAGVGLIAIVLILAICGCALRKCLIPHWLIWTYFTFATIIIFAHTGNNSAAWVADIEIPVLVVLICYILRVLFRRRPRYTYIEKTIYNRELAKGRVYKVSTEENITPKNGTAREIKIAKEINKENTKVVEVEDKTEQTVDTEQRKTDVREIEIEERKAEAAKLAAAEQAAREAREAEKVATEQVARQVAHQEVKSESTANTRVDKTDFLNVKPARPTATQPQETVTSINLPTVEPIPDKSYEPVREPLISTTPVSERIPDLKFPKTTNQTVNQRNLMTTTNLARTTTGITRPTTVSSSNTATANATATNTFASMYKPQVVKTSTITNSATADTKTNTVNVVSASHTINGNTTSATAIKATSTVNGVEQPHSTEDIMAAIERLRASMKK